MSAHLLSLADLNDAAPGVLEVVFGPDGDFEGAPCWTPSGWEIHPMLTDPHYAPAKPTDIPHLWLPGHGWAFRTFTELSLDLRQPSVAARLAGLCGLALGHTAPATWSIQNEWRGVFALIGVAHEPRVSWDSMVVMRWGRGRAMGAGTGGDPQHPSFTCTAEDRLSFLAALTLFLAPRIAALRKP